MSMPAIGPFQVVDVIDTGGMANVYRAIHPQTRQVVALKVLCPEYEQDRLVVQRFRHEALIAARLRHPHIVPVLEVYADAPPYYMVLRYFGGGNLAMRLARGALSPIEAVAIALPLCNALDYAHHNGTVHRDIKPANILFDEEGRPVLTDFGVAFALGLPRLTQRGMLFGTPEYMSPEQAKGQSLGPRSDLYSLAAVLYEMLTGTPPIQGREPLEILRKIIQEPIIPPSRRQAAIPLMLEQVVMRGLAKDPALRYASGAEFAHALYQAVANAPGMAPMPDQRRRLLLAGVCGVGLLWVGLCVYLLLAR